MPDILFTDFPSVESLQVESPESERAALDLLLLLLSWFVAKCLSSSLSKYPFGDLLPIKLGLWCGVEREVTVEGATEGANAQGMSCTDVSIAYVCG